MSTDATLLSAAGQSWLQVAELLIAFALSSLVGLERQLRGKSAGLRTQAIVGTTAALMVLVSKYGFTDVLQPGLVMLDPSRVAAQIVSGVGFLGAGLILTRRGAVRGLTTAAAVWETAAIGMAAGAGLPVLGVLVTGLHFVTVFGYTALARRLPGSRASVATVRVTYLDGRGILRAVLGACTVAGWTVTMLRHEVRSEGPPARVGVELGLAGTGTVDDLVVRLVELDGVVDVEPLSEDDED